jgi:hypothetical protein
MKKQSQLILLGVLAVGGFYAYKKGMFGKKTTDITTPEETTPEEKTPEEKTNTGGGESYTTRYTPATTTTTATIDQSGGGNIKETIEKAKQLVSEVKDLTVKIKTPKGKPNVKIAKKKKISRKVKRKFDIKTLQRIAKTDCTKIKRTGAKARCEKKVAQAKKDIQMYMLRLQSFKR